MSTHEIHGITVTVTVSQVSAEAKGRCIGKVVNICREMPAPQFLRAVEAWDRIPGTNATADDYRISGEVLDAIDSQLFGGAIANISRA